MRPYSGPLFASASRTRVVLFATFSLFLIFFICSRPTTDIEPWKIATDELRHKLFSSTSSKQPTGVSSAGKPIHTDLCEGFPDTRDIMLVMKTGATVAYDKLPIHLMTTLKCAADSVVFSDMKMDMAGHEVIDVLEDFPRELMEGNDDFDLYRSMQHESALNQDPRLYVKGSNGWKLDKYKFIPMLAKTWRRRQDASWYVFIEADTGLNWHNLRTFLDKFNPKEKLYIGSPARLDLVFGHGGTGYVISNAAMKAAVGDHPELEEKYNKEVKNHCCGDRMVARVLLDEGIKLTRAWPMMNGENPVTLPFGAAHWCQPVITMHHLNPEEVSKVWSLEQQMKLSGKKEPMMWKDVFEHFIDGNLLVNRTDWDNLSNDITYVDDNRLYDGTTLFKDLPELERASVKSPQNCAALCESKPKCFGWRHWRKECNLSWSIKLGNRQPRDGDIEWVSGWNFGRITAFRSRMNDCKAGPDWSYKEPSEAPIGQPRKVVKTKIIKTKIIKAKPKQD